MDLRSLRYFVAVVDHQGFSRAAEQLHVTQPTVSKMIAQLEQSLDLVLLERTGKRFTPARWCWRGAGRCWPCTRN